MQPPSERTHSLAEKIYDFVTDFSDPLKNPLVGIGVNVGRDIVTVVVVKTVEKVMRKVGSGMLLKIQEKAFLLAAKQLEKLGAKLGAEILAKFGIRAGEKLAIRTAEKIAARLATQTAAAATTGPAMPFVEAALLYFDVMSISLDILDMAVPGGTVGYAKMGTNEQYYEMRDKVNNQMKEIFEQNGLLYPLIAGPLDKLGNDDFSSQILIEQTNIINDPTNPLVKPMFDLITSDAAQGLLTEADTADDVKMEKYTKLLDLEKIFNECSKRVCTTNGGINVSNYNQNMCSYKDKISCNSSYNWPLKEDSTDTYVEWKTHMNDEKGACVVADSGLRGICQTNNIPYDENEGTCAITEEYCKSKGADWARNPKLDNQFDCMISSGQEVAELMFGTTIVRGLKQIFDPAQYETCKPGEFDGIYTCHGCPDGWEADNGLNTAIAVLGGVITLGAGSAVMGVMSPLTMCYPKCPSGYHKFGCCICEPDGGPRIVTNVFERYRCPAGKHMEALSCVDDCPPGWNSTPGFCQEPLVTYAKNTYARGVGTIPSQICPQGWHGQGWGIGGWCDNGGGVFPPFTLQTMPSGGITCGANDLQDGLCYTPCAPGYNGTSFVCWRTCAPGYVDTGAFCSKGGTVNSNHPLPPILAPCGPGLRDDTASCWLDDKGVGTGKIASTRVKQRTTAFSTRDN